MFAFYACAANNRGRNRITLLGRYAVVTDVGPPTTRVYLNRMLRMLRATRCAIVVLLLCLSSSSCGLRAGEVLLLPSGYKGWVVIRYEIAGQPRLSRSGFKTLVRVPVSGSLETSSKMEFGYGVDEFYYVNSADERMAISSESGNGCKPEDVCARRFQFYTSPVRTAVFFVGTAKELVRYPEPKVP